MAADNIQDLPSPAGKANSGGNPLIPILLVIILLPVLTFLMMEYFIIPRLKTVLSQELGNSASREGATEAGPGGGGAGHGSNGGHGAEGREGADTYKLENVVANLSGSLKSRYVKVSFTLEGHHPAFHEIVQHNEAKLVDTTLGILSTLTLSDLEEPGVKNVLRSDLPNAFESALNGKVIEQLYFSEFVVQ